MPATTLIGNYDRVNSGQVFVGLTATPSAIPVSNSTSPTFVLWNRAGSGIDVIPLRYSAGWTGTTEAPGDILFNVLLNAGAALGTAAPVSAFTAGTLNTTIFNAKVGANGAPQCSFGTAATLTTAGVPMMTSGMSHLTTTGTATFGSFTYDYVFWDIVRIPPGVAWYTTASAATASTYNQSIAWLEVPSNS